MSFADDLTFDSNAEFTMVTAPRFKLIETSMATNSESIEANRNIAVDEEQHEGTVTSGNGSTHHLRKSRLEMTAEEKKQDNLRKRLEVKKKKAEKRALEGGVLLPPPPQPPAGPPLVNLKCSRPNGIKTGPLVAITSKLPEPERAALRARNKERIKRRKAEKKQMQADGPSSSDYSQGTSASTINLSGSNRMALGNGGPKNIYPNRGKVKGPSAAVHNSRQNEKRGRAGPNYGSSTESRGYNWDSWNGSTRSPGQNVSSYSHKRRPPPPPSNGYNEDYSYYDNSSEAYNYDYYPNEREGYFDEQHYSDPRPHQPSADHYRPYERYGQPSFSESYTRPSYAEHYPPHSVEAYRSIPPIPSRHYPSASIERGSDDVVVLRKGELEAIIERERARARELGSQQIASGSQFDEPAGHSINRSSEGREYDNATTKLLLGLLREKAEEVDKNRRQRLEEEKRKQSEDHGAAALLMELLRSRKLQPDPSESSHSGGSFVQSRTVVTRVETTTMMPPMNNYLPMIEDTPTSRIISIEEVTDPVEVNSSNTRTLDEPGTQKPPSAIARETSEAGGSHETPSLNFGGAVLGDRERLLASKIRQLLVLQKEKSSAVKETAPQNSVFNSERPFSYEDFGQSQPEPERPPFGLVGDPYSRYSTRTTVGRTEANYYHSAHESTATPHPGSSMANNIYPNGPIYQENAHNSGSNWRFGYF